MSRPKQRIKSLASEEPVVDQSPVQGQTPAPNGAPAEGRTATPASTESDIGEALLAHEATDAAGAADAPQVPTAELTESQQIAAIQKKHDEVHERLLRVSADYQNYVRRSVQNITAATDQQLMDIAKSLITVLDHFDRALEADPQKTSAQSLLKGVQIVHEELLKALERFGVQRFNVSVGESFDPTCHEALMRQNAEGLETDQVVEQIQSGYTLRDKILRAAKVSVST